MTEMVAAAVPAFAAALGVRPGRGAFVGCGRAVRVLDLHAAALVAVLDATGHSGRCRCGRGRAG